MNSSEPEKPFQASGLTRIWNACFYSLDGLKAAFQSEAAFRQEAVLCCILVPLAFFIPVSISMRALMISSVLLVLIVEILNSSIEAVVDRISLEKHPLAKRAKDMGSAAVFLSMIHLTGVWGFGTYELLSRTP
ncbi:MAG: diacylglycerol kinase [SAR324 cluster bacterium]|nr:diacylglycerol kinase [SAR324 cluster bacterium]